MWKEYWKAFQAKNPCSTSHGDGVKFEDLIEALLRAMYGKSWIRTKKSHDNNRDFYIFDKNTHIWAECKNYRNSIAMDILAPTLVMAQVFEINKILFFSRSDINRFAKDKILAFGEKSNKEIFFYDGELLESLIKANKHKLPKKFRPLDSDSLCGPKGITIKAYFSQNAVTGGVDAFEQYVAYEKAELVRYQEPFAIIITVHTSIDPCKYSLQFSDARSDRKCIKILKRGLNKEENDQIITEGALEGGQGLCVSINAIPAVYKNELTLPGFTLQCMIAGQKVENVSIPPQKVRCCWVGQTALIGSQYIQIVEKTKNILRGNSSLSCLALTGPSGTGKTRLLQECINLFVEYGYNVLSFSAKENYASKYLLQEMISFIFEVPSTDFIDALERKYQAMEINRSSKESLALQMMLEITSLDSEESVVEYISHNQSLLFERLATKHAVLVLDNMQFMGKAALFFVDKFITYATNCRAHVNAVPLVTFNRDYMTPQAANALFLMEHADIKHFLSQNVHGFETNSVGVMFLRELTRVSTDQFDDLFSSIVDKVSLIPYNLYQTVKFLEENNAIQPVDVNRSYILEYTKARKLISEISNGIDDVLSHRWDFLSAEISLARLHRICSALVLFKEIDEDLSILVSVSVKNMRNLSQKNFLKEKANGIFTFDHTILRQYYMSKFPEHCLDSIKWIAKKHATDTITAFPQAYTLLKCCVAFDFEYLVFFCKNIKNIFIPQYLSGFFWNNILKCLVQKGNMFDSCELWIDSLHFVCEEIRKCQGSETARTAFLRAWQAIRKVKGNEVLEAYCHSYRTFLHSYCDILLQIPRKDEALVTIDQILKECQKAHPTNSENQDELLVLMAIMYNRKYCVYNNEQHIPCIAKIRESLMQTSRKISKQIVNKTKRHLIEYLNASDEGYNYYGYQSEKNQLISIWNDCLTGMPDAIPEKTLNYYRKLIQYDLIDNNFSKALSDIACGRDYLSTGEFSHEPLIFNTFFLMAEVISYLQEDPQRYGPYIKKLIKELVDIQYIVSNSKMGDILMLAMISSFYLGEKENVYFYAKSAFELYKEKKVRRYPVRIDLLLENIRYMFSILDMYNASYNLNFLPPEFQTSLSPNEMNSHNAKGIIQSLDGKVNYPLLD